MRLPDVTMMQKKQWIAISALAVVSVLAVPLLAGCGGGKAAVDPLVGTWRELGAGGKPEQTPLIITRTQGGYLATVVFWGPELRPASPRPTFAFPLTRQGDKLLGTYKAGNVSARVEMTYLPASGHMTWANSRTPDGPLNKPTEMVKVSSGTAYPSTP
jgi:hypothetical protein